MNSENQSNHQSDWEICVVCGNSIEPGRGAARLNHLGNTVNLCGPACRETFAQEPDPYLARLAKRMREQELREGLQFDGLDGGLEQGLRGPASQPVMGAKRDLVKRAAVALLFGSLFVASATKALSADISTNLPTGGMTNVAAPIRAPHDHGTAATLSLSALQAGPLLPATGMTNVFGDYFQAQSTEAPHWCAQGSSNLLCHTAAACCALRKPLGAGIDWKLDGATAAASGATPGRVFRFFDGAVISGSRSGENYKEPDRPGTFFTGFISGGDWPGPDAARKSRGLRLFSWSW